MGILAIAMIFGGVAATAALIAGKSFLMALAIYSGCGVLSVFMLVAVYMISTALRSRQRPGLSQSDLAAQ